MLRVIYSTVQEGASGCVEVETSGPEKAMELIISFQ